MAEYIFGDMEFMGRGSQLCPTLDPAALVWQVEDIIDFANDEDAERYCREEQYDAYLCPETYAGKVIYMDEYMEKANAS